MANEQYPTDTVQGLLNTDLVNQNTSAILKNRLEQPDTIVAKTFDEPTFGILKAVCSQLIPQTDRLDKIDLAGMLDEQLADGKGNGWRYDKMPTDETAFKLGMKGIDETAEAMFGDNFTDLDDAEQDGVLNAIQKGEAQGKIWEEMPAKLFFEELLTSITELYYSHPTAKNEIGEVAFADAKGWENIGLNELAPQEPKPIVNNIQPINNDSEKINNAAE